MIEKSLNLLLVLINFGAAFCAGITLMNARLIRIKDSKLKHPILASHGIFWMLFALFVAISIGYENFFKYSVFASKDIFGGNYFIFWIWMSPFILAAFLLEHMTRSLHKRRLPSNIIFHKRMISFKDKFPSLPTKGFYSLFKKWNHFYDLEITDYEISLEKLSSEFNRLKIIFISDIHFGKYPEGFLQEVISLSNESKPDILLFGGDLVSRERFIERAGEMMKLLSAKEKKFAVLGNHDYWTDSTKIEQALTDAGFDVLKNDIAQYSRNGATLTILGIDSPRSKISIAAKKLKETENNSPEIIMTHNPDHIAGLKIKPHSIIICGHTHGGQIQFPYIGPILLPSSFNRTYSEGVYIRRGNLQIIGRGVGGDPPFRYRCRPELIRITLFSKK